MSTAPQSTTSKPEKPSPDFPLTPHAGGKWCKKVEGKIRYFGRWADPAAALGEYLDFIAGKEQPVSGKPKPKKVKKPTPKFPLTPHPTGRWCKRILGKLVYFGPIGDPTAALALYNEQKDDLHAGRRPRQKTIELTVSELVNRFLSAKRLMVNAGELTARSWGDYHACCSRVVGAFGRDTLVSDLAAEDFEKYKTSMAKTWGPIAVANEIQRVRTLFRYGFDADLFALPIKFGPGFKRPGRKVMRLNRARKPEKMFTPADLRKIIAAADQPLKAMILLGVNCGYGNADVGMLPLTALDLENGWAIFPRPKTGVARKAKLWPETIQAIHESLESRPAPKDPEAEALVFVTKYGKPWHRDTRMEKLTSDKPLPPVCSPISGETTKLLKTLKLKKSGFSFYTLRHIFETIAGAARDQVAVDHVMGHADQSMSAAYRERIEDDRIEMVCNHVRNWLFAAVKLAELVNDQEKAVAP